MNQHVEFIYFDLGNVILNFDHEIACRNVAKVTGVSAAEVRRIIHDSSLQVDFETGKLGSTDFVAEFGRASGTNPNPQEVLRAVSDVFSLNRSIMPVLTQLRASGFPIGILSNTCAAHWEFIKLRFPILPLIFDERFQILSFNSRSMKPDAKIFQDAIGATGFSPKSIFFTDDMLLNVAGARAQSIQAEVFESAAKLTRQLNLRGIRVNL